MGVNWTGEEQHIPSKWQVKTGELMRHCHANFGCRHTSQGTGHYLRGEGVIKWESCGSETVFAPPPPINTCFSIKTTSEPSVSPLDLPPSRFVARPIINDRSQTLLMVRTASHIRSDSQT